MKFNGLDLVNIGQNTKSGSSPYNQNIILDNSSQYIINEFGLEHCSSINDISNIAGIIPFDKGFCVFADKCIYVIKNDYSTTPYDRIYKTFTFTNITFDPNYPIRGTYSYNSKKELIIVFSAGIEGAIEDKLLNINLYNDGYIFTKNDEYLMDLIPNIQFPSLITNYTTGSLLAGTYQFSIAYKTIDGNYTNSSLLSIPSYVYNDNCEVGDATGVGINILLSNLDSNYKEFKLNIIYNTSSSTTVYYRDYKINQTSIIISNFNDLLSSSLSEITINYSSYIKSESQCFKDNKLYRANVKSHILNAGVDNSLQLIANTTSLNLIETNEFTRNSTLNVGNYDKDKLSFTNKIRFQYDEYYALYITFLDIKGNIVGTYPIRTTNTGTNIFATSHSNGIDKLYMIHSHEQYTDSSQNDPYDRTLYKTYLENYITVTLNPIYINNAISSYPHITSWCVHRAIRNFSNSHIINQGLCCTHNTNVIKEDDNSIESDKYNRYMNIFDSDTCNIGVRYYSFEDLFNKANDYSNCRIVTLGSILKPYRHSGKHRLIFGCFTNGAYDNETYTNLQLDTRGAKIYSNRYVDYNTPYARNPRLEYTNLLYSKHNSTGGMDSTLQLKYKIDDTYKNILCLANIYNSITDYYTDLYNQELALCSTIYPLTTNIGYIYGDTFIYPYRYNFLFYKDEDLELLDSSASNPVSDDDVRSLRTESQAIFIEHDVNETLTSDYDFDDKIRFHSIVCFTESKYNLGAVRPNTKSVNLEECYRYSNIKDSYDKVYNKQSTQNVTTIIDTTKQRQSYQYEFQSRIVVSDATNLESNIINWRIFRPANYYDMSYARLGIVAIYASYKYLYIQQELALSIASSKDLVTSNTTGDLYVGSSDIFDRIPTEIVPTTYGYIGCKSYFNTSFNDIGLFIIDSVKSKLFHITDEFIERISDINDKWFINKGSFIIPDMGDINNRRILLINHNNNFNISYNPILKDFLSFHTYIPTFGFYNRYNTFMLYNNKFYKYTKTNKCLFFNDTPEQSIVATYYNEQPVVNKKIESISWDSRFSINNTEIYDKTFDFIMAYNDSQCSAKVELNRYDEWFTNLYGVIKNETWSFNNIIDYVINNKLPFLQNYIEPISTNMNYNKEWFDLSKFISTFVVIVLYFNNDYYSIDAITKSTIPDTIIKYQPEIMLRLINTNNITNNR